MKKIKYFKKTKIAKPRTDVRMIEVFDQHGNKVKVIKDITTTKKFKRRAKAKYKKREKKVKGKTEFKNMSHVRIHIWLS